MARAKNNIAAKSDNQTLGFYFDTCEVGRDPETGETIRAPYVVFKPGYVDVTATEALSAASENKSPAQRDEAKQFLQAILAGGVEVPMTEVKDAAEGNGLSWRTVRRAQKELDVVVKKDNSTPGGRWFWRLPE
jgi:putative DNA primase/helicase